MPLFCELDELMISLQHGVLHRKDAIAMERIVAIILSQVVENELCYENKLGVNLRNQDY